MYQAITWILIFNPVSETVFIPYVGINEHPNWLEIYQKITRATDGLISILDEVLYIKANDCGYVGHTILCYNRAIKLKNLK